MDDINKIEKFDTDLDEALRQPVPAYLSMSFQAKVLRKIALRKLIAEQRSNAMTHILGVVALLPALGISLLYMGVESLQSLLNVGGFVLSAFIVAMVFQLFRIKHYLPKPKIQKNEMK